MLLVYELVLCCYGFMDIMFFIAAVGPLDVNQEPLEDEAFVIQIVEMFCETNKTILYKVKLYVWDKVTHKVGPG